MPVSSLSHQAATGLGLQPACLSALWGSYHVLQQTHIIKQAPASGPHKARLSQNPWPLQPSSDFVVQPKRTLWLLPSPAISELAKIHHCDDSGSRPAHWYHLSVALGLSFQCSHSSPVAECIHQGTGDADNGCHQALPALGRTIGLDGSPQTPGCRSQSRPLHIWGLHQTIANTGPGPQSSGTHQEHRAELSPSKP